MPLLFKWTLSKKELQASTFRSYKQDIAPGHPTMKKNNIYIYTHMHIFFLIDMRAQRKARCICTYEYICRKVFAAQCARKKHTEQHMGASWLAQEVQFDLAVL